MKKVTTCRRKHTQRPRDAVAAAQPREALAAGGPRAAAGDEARADERTL